MLVTVVAEQESNVTPSGGRHSSQVTAATDQVSLDTHWWRASGGAEAIYLASFVTYSDCGRAGRVSSVPMAVSIVSESPLAIGFPSVYEFCGSSNLRLQFPCIQGAWRYRGGFFPRTDAAACYSLLRVSS
jgi:hypothetical protein